MWGCDYFPFSSWMGGGFAGGIFSLLLWGLIIFIVVYLIIKLIGTLRDGKTIQRRDRSDSLAILKMRLAKGEISQEDYIKMKETLLMS